MNINNPPKFYGIILMIAALTLLVAIARVEWDQAAPVFTAIMGYLVGNGVAARNGEDVTPAIGRKKRGE